MADTFSDSDPDSAAMAEAMGFSGFGMQRGTNKKRKLTPPSHTGANSAPLGKRRLPLNLPKPVVSGSGAGAGGNDDGDGGEEGNPEEIDLDDDDEGAAAAGEGDGIDGDVGAAGPPPLGRLTVNDDAPNTAGPQHHPLPPRPQQQQNHHHHHQTHQNASRRPGGGGRGPGKAPWWEGEWDPRLVARMIENPWDRLERQRGFGALGEWPQSTAAGARGGAGAGAGGPAALRGGEEAEHLSGGSAGVVGSSDEMGVVGQQAAAAQTTVS